MTNRCRYCGRQDWCNCALDHPEDREPVRDCIRGCCRVRRHYRDCLVDDGADSAWVPWEPDFDRDELFDGDARLDVRRSWYRALAKIVRHDRATGSLQIEVRCPGCLPARATHGQLCSLCHTRLSSRLNPQATGSVLWAYNHLEADLTPGGHGQGEKVSTSRTPPVPIVLDTLDLRQEILTEVGIWLAATCRAFGLHGPDWWRMRVEEASRRSWAPQDPRELADAVRYLAMWLDRIERSPNVTQLYDASEKVLSRVAGVAPWRGRTKKIKDFPCPECGRYALVRHDGAVVIQCRRCKHEFGQDHDIWTKMNESERLSA